jgi:hypothetical protein
MMAKSPMAQIKPKDSCEIVLHDEYFWMTALDAIVIVLTQGH